MEKEIFVDIPDYEDLYQVSNFGRIKSLKCNREKILKPALAGPNKWKYFAVNLLKDNKVKYSKIHRLVLISFKGYHENPEFNQVDHIDKNRLNNYLTNLRWLNRSGNLRNTNRKTSSRYIGVYFCKNLKKWKSIIRIDYENIHLAVCKNEIEAAKAYDQALIDYNIRDRDPNFKN